jgi:Lon-like ATP-dependent protease
MEISAEKLRKVFDPERDIKDLKDISVKDGIIGQEKAFEALRVGAGVNDKNFQMFVTGAADTGKTNLVKRCLEEIAKRDKKNHDWIYVFNFEDSDEPRLISLAQGEVKEFKKDIDGLIVSLRQEIPLLLKKAKCQQKIDEATKILREHKFFAWKAIIEEAVEAGCVIIQIPDGHLIAVPANPDNPKEAISQEKFESLDEEKQKELSEKKNLFSLRLVDCLNGMSKIDKNIQQATKEVQTEEVGNLFLDLSIDIREKHEKNSDVLLFLDSIEKDVIKNIPLFTGNDNGCGNRGCPNIKSQSESSEKFFSRYDINIFVDNSDTSNVPIVVETNPSWSNLFGGIEHEMMQGGILTTNFLNIKAGALHRANGGYLIIPAYNLFRAPFCWDGLKRSIKDQEIKMDNPMSSYFGNELKTLKPEPMPFNGKIILIGDSWIYWILYEYDDQFRNIFKVKVELDDKTDYGPEMIADFLGAMAAFCEKNNFLHFDKTAAARLLEYLSELSGSQKKLSLRLGEVEDILKEANFWAREEGSSIITVKHIEKTLEEKERRSDLMEKRLLEAVKDKILKIEVDGSKIGQINGLSVYPYADHFFGLPTRITARVGAAKAGKEGIINIERECDLAGPVQSKSVFIIAGYLKGRYGKKHPLSLSASLCFEQSYDGVEGDSASIAELASIISALAEVPIGQNLAVTGSMNQQGEIQPIGGVNYKIRGWFNVCADRGLTGNQGVIIPEANMNDLMLPKNIIEAVNDKKFHIYIVSTIDEAIKYLTSFEMSKIDEKILKPGLWRRLLKSVKKIF